MVSKIYIYLLIGGYILLAGLFIVVVLFLRQTCKRHDKDYHKHLNITSVPWEEILDENTPQGLSSFAFKYNLWNDNPDRGREYYHITFDGMLFYIWSRCTGTRYGSQLAKNESFWKIFHHIGDELIDGGWAHEYYRFCSFQCKEDPLLFYRRYCVGDEPSLRRYQRIFYHEPLYPESAFFKENVENYVRSMDYMVNLIKNADDIQPDNDQRMKDVAVLKTWFEETRQFLYKSGSMTDSKTPNEPAKDKYRDEILDAEGTNWQSFYDANLELDIDVNLNDKITPAFKAEGILFNGYSITEASMPGLVRYLCGFHNGVFFTIRNPSELKQINPTIENVDQALLFVRFFTTPGYLYLFKERIYMDKKNRLLAWISSTVPFVEVFKEGDSNESNIISIEDWNAFKLEDVVTKKENDVFVIERNGVRNNKGSLGYGSFNQLIRSSEMVTSDGNYLFTVKKEIGTLKNPIIFRDEK
jgi:hypothetical protein